MTITLPANVAPNELIQSAWGNSVVDALDELDNEKLNLTGGTLTSTLALPVTQSFNAQAAVHKTYVDTTFVELAGDTMTGTLTGTNVNMSGNVIGATLSCTGIVHSDNTIRAGVPVVSTPAAGYSIATDGTSLTCVNNAGSANPTIAMNRTGAGAGGNGQNYIRFSRTSSDTAIGSITIATTSTVAYNTSSDGRLKQRTGDIADASNIVKTLGAKAYRGQWITDEDAGEWVFLNSSDIEQAAPYAVHGTADAVTATGEIEPQLVDFGKLVPLLTAALAQALDRIDGLEGAA